MGNKQTNNKIIIIGLVLAMAVVIVLMILFLNKQEKYTINFNANNGTKIASIIVDKDGIIEKLEDPVKEGYIFAGWYYGDEPFDFSKPITSDMELEARWVVDVSTEDVEDKEDLQEDNEKVEENKENNKVEDNKENNKVENNKDEKPNKEPKDEQPKEEIIAVTGVSLDKTSLTLTEGGNSKLTATVNPSNATNKNVAWSSSNSSVATVDSNGNVTAIKPGTATITVTTSDGGYKATCTVTVNEKPASYVVTFTAKAMYEGGPINQYAVSVTKNGSACNYIHVRYNGEVIGKFADAGKVATRLENAIVRLTDGTDVNASVVFK